MVNNSLTKVQLRGLQLLIATFILFIIGFLAILAINTFVPKQVLLALPDNGPLQVTGEVLCLPHKDSKGTQTLECAFGIKDNEGRYYALQDSSKGYEDLDDLPMGQRVVVTGTFEQGESKIYPTVGTITVTDISPPKQ